MGWLVDANIVSEMRLPRADVHVRAWIKEQDYATLNTSAVVLMELRFGAETAPDAKRPILESWIEGFVLEWFGPRILPVDDAALLAWRRMMEAVKRQGSVSAAPDLLIAAQAQNNGLIVASRDIRIFSAAGVPVFNPWTSELHAPGRTLLKLPAASLAQALRALRRTR
jgi:toxin FitB